MTCGRHDGRGHVRREGRGARLRAAAGLGGSRRRQVARAVNGARATADADADADGRMVAIAAIETRSSSIAGCASQRRFAVIFPRVRSVVIVHHGRRSDDAAAALEGARVHIEPDHRVESARAAAAEAGRKVVAVRAQRVVGRWMMVRHGGKERLQAASDRSSSTSASAALHFPA